MKEFSSIQTKVVGWQSAKIVSDEYRVLFAGLTLLELNGFNQF